MDAPEVDAAFEDYFLAVECSVELRDAASRHVGLVRTVQLNGICVEFPSGKRDWEALAPGRVLKVHACGEGALARVVSTSSGNDHLGRPVISASLSFIDVGDGERFAAQMKSTAKRSTVFVIGMDIPNEPLCGKEFRVLPAASIDTLLASSSREEVAVLVLGANLDPAEALNILARYRDKFPNRRTMSIILNAGPSPELFQDLINQDCIFFLTRGPIPLAQLRSIVQAACHKFDARGGGTEVAPVVHGERAARALEFCARLSEESTQEGVASVLIEAAESLISASRAQYLLFDRARDILWRKDPITGEERRESAAAGMIGYVARTGEPVRIADASADPRFDPDADDPVGTSAPAFLAEPVLALRGSVAGVVSVVRPASLGPFSEDDVLTLRLLAAHAAPAAELIRLRSALHGFASDKMLPAGQEAVFRQEALDYSAKPQSEQGGLLTSAPRWLSRSHWLMLAFILIGLLFLSVARIEDRAAGSALIRSRRRVAVTASHNGVVRSVAVSAGDKVRIGDVLVRFDGTPGNSTVDGSPEQVRAPQDGRVSDISVRSGQQLVAGDRVVSIVDEDAGYELIGLLPGSCAPQLHQGMPLILKVQGYPDSHDMIAIDQIGGEIVGPREAVQYLGRESADALAVEGPIVIVRARMQKREFTASGRSFPFKDGMAGEVTVTLRSEPMIVSLIPGLRELIAKR